MNQLNVDSKWIGIPFKWEGVDPTEGMDCATFVTAFLKEYNIDMPCPESYEDGRFRKDPQKLIRYMLKHGEKVSGIFNFQPLDIVVFSVHGKIAHVGVYIGYGKFVHVFANKKSGIDRLVGTHWGEILYCAIRPTRLIGNNDPALEVPEEVKIGDPVSLTVMFISAVVLAATASSVMSAVVLFALTIAAYAAATLLAPRPKTPSVASARYGFGPLQNTATSELPVPVLYGQLKLAGNAIYQDDPAEEVDRCDCIGEGIMNAVTDVRVNDIAIGDLTGCSNTWYSGDTTQTVDARFSASVPGLRNTAYLALTLAASDKLKGGFPTVTGVFQGVKIKTNSGGVWSGTTYSNNPAACIRDFLTNTRYGVGLAEILIDDVAFGEEYDYCAASVSDNAGSTEARYACDYIIDTRRPALDILEDLLATCNGVLVWSGNVLRLKLDKANNSVQDFDMDNIREGSFSYQYISKDELANRIKLQYIDSTQNYTKVFAIAENKADQDLRASKEGGNGVIEREMAVFGVTKFSRAVRLAYACLRRLQACNITIRFTTATEAIHCEPWDVIEVSHDVSAWVKKPFRIVSISEIENDEMTITAVEYNSSIYDDAYSSSIVAYQYGDPTVGGPIGERTTLDKKPDTPTLTFEKVNDRGYISWDDDQACEISYYEIWKSHNNSWGGEETLYQRVVGTRQVVAAEIISGDVTAVPATNQINTLAADVIDKQNDFFNNNTMYMSRGLGRAENHTIDDFSVSGGSALIQIADTWDVTPDTTTQFRIIPLWYYKVRGVTPYQSGDLSSAVVAGYEGTIADLVVNTSSILSKTVWDCVVNPSGGGDYGSIIDAVNDGNRKIFLEKGTHVINDTKLGVSGRWYMSGDAYDDMVWYGSHRDGVILDFQDSNNDLYVGVRDVMNAGTVTVSDGSTTVTGSGDAIFSGDFVGLYVVLGAHFYKIASITDAATLEVAEAYNGKDLVRAQYCISDLTQNVHFENLTFKPAGAARGRLAIGCTRGVVVKNCHFLEFSAVSHWFPGGVHQEGNEDTIIEGCIFDKAAINLISPMNTIINNCTIWDAETNGIYIDDDTVSDNLRVIIANTTSRNCAHSGIHAYVADNISIMGSSFINNGQQGIELSNGADNCVVQGCQVTGNESSGISAGTDNSLYVGNVVVNNTNYGLACGGDWNTFVGNIIKDNTDDGIWITGAGAVDNSIIGNQFAGNGGENIDDDGTGTISSDNQLN